MMLSPTASAAPCAHHTGAAKKACVQQAKRDAMDWPPQPVKPYEIRRRVGAYNWRKAYRVSVCETGHTLDWHMTGTYRGALGMYAATWQHGVERTGGYDGDTWAEQVAIAVAAHDITHGWSGWGCGGA